MKWPLSKLYKITPPTRLHLISRDKPDSFSSRRSLLVAAFSYIIKKCIPPHPSRYSPFIVMRYARNLAVLLNYRSQRSLIFTPNKRPRGTPMQSAQGWRSQTKGESRKRTEESLLSSGRFRLSPATGAGRQVARATPCFHPIDFHITTQPSLVLSWAPRKYRPPRPSFRPPSSLLSSPLPSQI